MLLKPKTEGRLRRKSGKNLRSLHLQVERSQLKTERQESQLLSLRSTWGSTGDLRDVLPNPRRSISEFDLRLSDRGEEEPIASGTLRQNCSFGFPEDMNEISGKKNVAGNMSSEDVQSSVNMTSSPSSRLRSFSDSPDLSSFITRKFKPSVGRRLLNQREFRGSLPSICITPSTSDVQCSPFLTRIRDSSVRNVENREGNESRQDSINPEDQKKETEEEEKEKGKHQPQSTEKGEDVMCQRKVGVVTVTSQASLEDLPAMDMQLRDETRTFEGVINTEAQNGGSSCK